MKKWRSILLAAALCVTLTACGSAGDTSQPDESGASSEEPVVSTMAPVEPEPEPEPEIETQWVNPLTGEATQTDISQNRPIAIMLNNLKKALPQLGVSQADIIYECPAEGGITRMLGVFQSVEGVGEIGTVRSARDYYVSLAYGLDAIFLHAGGSPQAYDAIQTWGVTALDCVNGPYEGTLFWRDAARKKSAGLEHSVLTSGEKISELLPTYSKVTLEHKEGYTQPLEFMASGETASGDSAKTVTVKFSGYKTGVFEYDESTGLYNVSEYGSAYVDGNTGEQVAVKNVLVLYTDVSTISGDEKGRLTVRTTGTGTGQFFCDGVAQDITWSKKDNASPLVYTTADGKTLKLGVGHTYVNIIGGTSSVTVE
jgi:hypothetical protein